MASTPVNELQGLVSRVRLVGRTDGRVRQLPGFDKSRHTVPDAVNAATTAFLGRLCGGELAAGAEELFQRTRAALAYKRRDLTLDVTPPVAVLEARDFTFELSYALEERAPDQYVVTRTLHQVRDAEVVRRAEFGELFAGQFSEVDFVLKKAVRVEAIVDAVEALEGASGLRVEYPSDCRDCTLTVEGVEASVVCDGASLSICFIRAGSPRELLEAFAAVREAFALTKQPALFGLLG